MELARVNEARAAWLFDIEELNPLGRPMGDIFRALAARYKFAQIPDLGNPVPGRNLKFLDGRFEFGPGPIEASVDLEVFRDGIVAISRSDTAHSDALIDDVLHWMRREYGVSNEHYILKPKRAYRSALTVFCPTLKPLAAYPSLSPFLDRLRSATGQDSEVVSVTLGNERERSLFTFERRAGQPFEDHKYFSAASVSTQTHLDLLRQFEETLSAKQERN